MLIKHFLVAVCHITASRPFYSTVQWDMRSLDSSSVKLPPDFSNDHLWNAVIEKYDFQYLFVETIIVLIKYIILYNLVNIISCLVQKSLCALWFSFIMISVMAILSNTPITMLPDADFYCENCEKCRPCELCKRTISSKSWVSIQVQSETLGELLELDSAYQKRPMRLLICPQGIN